MRRSSTTETWNERARPAHAGLSAPPGGEVRRGEGAPEASNERAGASPVAARWAQLGSNQQQPGYEPGALTD